MVKNGYATKEDLKSLGNSLNKSIKSLDTRILGSEVKILGELQKMREDNAAHQFSHMRINDDIQELQTKVKKLETTKI
jgi:polyhydroxyalkanoate synthesis regulator phasin